MRKQSLDFDALGDKHKKFESITQTKIIPGVPTLARLDGRAFHTLTKNAMKPFDYRIIGSMQQAAQSVLDEFKADFAFVQSDEITLGWSNLDMFEGKIQKLVSTMSSLASVIFQNTLVYGYEYEAPSCPTFDCRIWQVPSLEIAAENVMWREMDATRNSISMTAHANFTPSELHGKGTNEKLKMLEEKAVFWSAFDDVLKRGTYYKKVKILKTLSDEELKQIPEQHRPTEPVMRSVIQMMHYPKATSIANFADVLFFGKEVELFE